MMLTREQAHAIGAPVLRAAALYAHMQGHDLVLDKACAIGIAAYFRVSGLAPSDFGVVLGATRDRRVVVVGLPCRDGNIQVLIACKHRPTLWMEGVTLFATAEALIASGQTQTTVRLYLEVAIKGDKGNNWPKDSMQLAEWLKPLATLQKLLWKGAVA